MARFLFLQNIAFEYLGPMHLSAMLKAHGHDCDLLVLDEKEDIYSEIVKYDPHAILISSMTGPHSKYLDHIKTLKQRIKVPVIVGGPHPTFFPQILEDPVVDYICVGEGEETIVEFAEAIIENM